MSGSDRGSFTVETYSGYKADERPVGLLLQGRRIAVREILDRWYGEDHSYFKVTGEDGMIYIIRLDRSSDTWELVRTQVPATPQPHGEI